MQKGDAHQGSPAPSRLFRDRWPIAALIAVQGLSAAYLGWCKLLANRELAGGGKYAAPFQQVMYTIDWAGAALGFLFLVAAFLLPPQRWIDDIAAWLGRQARLVAVGVAVALMALSVVVERLARDFLNDGKLTQSEVNLAFREAEANLETRKKRTGDDR